MRIGDRENYEQTLMTKQLSWLSTREAYPPLDKQVLIMDMNGHVSEGYIDSDDLCWTNWRDSSLLNSWNIIAWAWPIVGSTGTLQLLYVGARCILQGTETGRELFNKIREAQKEPTR